MRLTLVAMAAALTFPLGQLSSKPQILDSVPEDVATRVTMNGELIVFGQRRDGESTISVRRMAGGEPMVLVRATEGRVVLSPALTPDGTLYFESNMRTPAIAGRDDSDIWIIDRQGSGWGRPRATGAPFDSEYNEHYPTVDASGTICFNSARPGGLGRNDIYCARGHATPAHVAALSSPSQDVAPWLSARGDRLLFASDRPGGLGGWDLYISTRSADGWSAPRNLGAPINTEADETWVSLNTAGDRLIFRRATSPPSGRVFIVPFDPAAH